MRGCIRRGVWSLWCTLVNRLFLITARFPIGALGNDGVGANIHLTSTNHRCKHNAQTSHPRALFWAGTPVEDLNIKENIRYSIKTLRNDDVLADNNRTQGPSPPRAFIGGLVLGRQRDKHINPPPQTNSNELKQIIPLRIISRNNLPQINLRQHS